ncbi:MAG TPA: cytidylate kinase-like family protein [Usitatibacter sp.]|nr:cytidylate kinase-like family protein [Usitatibacter sp.]
MPLIAMTREMGSLGRDVAAGIAERTQRKVVYQEIIEPIANKMRLRKSHVERFLDGKSGLWERLTTDKTSLSIFTADETFRFLRDGSTGVIRGWGAVHLLKEVPHVIRVRICAPLDLRIERMMERLGTDNREAIENEIEMSEEAHTAITRRHFGVNWRDPEHYDLVLSTERLSVEECVDEVECMTKKRRFQETPESIRMMENMALEWAVRSALRRDGRTAAMHVTITCNGGRIRLAGVVDTQREASAAAEVAASVEGARDVENELKPADSFASRYRREA